MNTLKSIELASFKSFGKKSLISLTAPVTCVVGPNGSGKSNIVEAFRFVLGEQSMKSYI
jgi:chromosome segregation protein